MSKRAIARLVVLVLGCLAQVSPASAQGRDPGAPGMFRPPGYGMPGGGGVSPLGTYGEIGDRTYAVGAVRPGAVGDRGSRVDAPRIAVPLGDYGVTIPVPGGVGTADMHSTGASPAGSAAPPGASPDWHPGSP